MCSLLSPQTLKPLLNPDDPSSANKAGRLALPVCPCLYAEVLSVPRKGRGVPASNRLQSPLHSLQRVHHYVSYERRPSVRGQESDTGISSPAVSIDLSGTSLRGANPSPATGVAFGRGTSPGLPKLTGTDPTGRVGERLIEPECASPQADKLANSIGSDHPIRR